MDFKVLPKRDIFCGLPVVAAVLALAATAQAASSTVVPCDQVGRELKSLVVPVNALTVDRVDHTPIDTGRAEPDAIDERSAVTDSVAPILYLTPRVTSIVRDVFGMTTVELPQESQVPRSPSPVADSDQASDAVEPADANTESSDLPRFQQRMFRTDI